MVECLIVSSLHVAVSVDSIKSADCFFCDVFGLKKTKEFVVSKKLCFDIFGVSEEVSVAVYEIDSVCFEVFISKQSFASGFSHVCLGVSDLLELKGRVSKYGFEFKVVQKNEKELYFVYDKSGNLFEIKQV